MLQLRLDLKEKYKIWLNLLIQFSNMKVNHFLEFLQLLLMLILILKEENNKSLLGSLLGGFIFLKCEKSFYSCP
jgi:hypothetical protein